MAHRGVCPDLACERIRQELEKAETKTAAFKTVAEELGLPWRTVETWHTRMSRQMTGRTRPRSEAVC